MFHVNIKLLLRGSAWRHRVAAGAQPRPGSMLAGLEKI